MFAVAVEEINTLVVGAVSRNDSSVDLDREANIWAGNLDRYDVYCLVELDFFLQEHFIGKSHQTNGRLLAEVECGEVGGGETVVVDAPLLGIQVEDASLR